MNNPQVRYVTPSTGSAAQAAAKLASIGAVLTASNVAATAINRSLFSEPVTFSEPITFSEPVTEVANREALSEEIADLVVSALIGF